jgi:TatA/E family protein of Tat protein translocase
MIGVKYKEYSALLPRSIRSIFMRILDIIVIAGIVLALFGPKTLQSLARNAGKTTREVKNAKDNFMAHENVSKVHEKESETAAVNSQSVGSVPSTETTPKHS